jgi:hypothetical protein
MKKNFSYPFTLIALFSVTSCATTITKLNTSGPYTYKINASGISNNIQTETINTANNLCRTLNKDYKFVRNDILPKSVMGIDLISYDLIFSCVDPGSAQDNFNGPETLPGSEENQATAQDDQDREKKLTASKAGSRKDKKTGITGDTPGEPESLGGSPQSKKLELEKLEGVIIEEKIFE